MIVKILSSASNFEGIDYSERKNDLGKSQLLKAANFGALGHNNGEVRKADYINYMKLICDANPRVKNRQFHAVISAKGQSYTAEQLANLAEQYLIKMGYGENPYLIYSHSDTENNHVHMVSTRVDKNGNKVNDSYEKIRSQKIIQSLINQDPEIEAKSAITEALDYNFSTKAQFKLLLELQGFKTTEDEGQLKIIKYGTVQTAIASDEVEKKIAAHIVPENRIKQLKAIFHKHKRGLELDAFRKKIHKKFGVELIFHQHKNHQTPYGYTIIDHKTREVLKGSQVLSLKELMLPVNMKERRQILDDYQHKFDFEKKTFQYFKSGLASMGFQIDSKGEVSVSGDKQIVGRLDSKQLLQLKYNSRIAAAAKYAISSDAEKKILAALFNIQAEKFTIQFRPTEDIKNYYKNLLINANPDIPLGEILATKKLEVIHFQNSHFLLDQTNKHLFEINSLLNGETIDMREVKVRDLDNPQGEDLSQTNSITSKIGQLSQLFDLPSNEQEQNGNRRRRKKKQRRI